ncbi:hypothetical protein KQX62_11980 [Rhodopseudomonas palustris]|uniref:Uncharacterized protein n=1 Tax=Rhodopseudomonas palustris TaxID=1076 RepID=A0AAX3E4F7_RHOPL|nr:hypothetical protein [Rhodopseudomonas palustris]UYO41960.1 hypothetical protein KQX62_11980 [Rhodopseudomonas palustris]
MDRMYKRKSAEKKAAIDAAVATASASDMERARKACDAIVRGYYFDFDELKEEHPKAYEVAMLFVS